MAFRCKNLNGLVTLLRENGDKILDASSKLSLSASLLYNLNSSLDNVWNQRQMFNNNFYVFESNQSELEFIYDFLQKTFALKILPDGAFWNNEKVLDVRLFKNLRLLEVQRLSFNLIKGLHTFRHQLKYLICIRSLRTIKEVLEYCGADNSEGFMWNELKEAVFSYNSIDSLDNSLEYAPCLHTLDLSHNLLHNAQLLNCLSNLKHINLSYNQLESVPAFSGELCSQLRILVLCNNFIENIDELAVLVNLTELNLSNNCLLEHSVLLPLANLPLLKYLNLIGNPLSFHPRHRINTAYYLHFNVANEDFVLENRKLNKGERQMIGSVRYVMTSTRSHLASVDSFESANTVIRVQCKNLSIGDTGVSSDMESSSSSVATIKSELGNEHHRSDKKKRCLITDYIGMHDSGIGTVNRPMSSSQLSIGSFSSTASNEKGIAAHYESDVEIISNPSQSSIEVICSDVGNTRSESVAIDAVNTLTTLDLKKVSDEQHRSL